jgi:hypothetical protein
MHNFESMRRTNKSYLAAFKKQTDLFPFLRLNGSGYSYCVGENFTAVNPPKNTFKFITDCSIKVDDLFDYDRPKIIEPTFRVAKSNFFVIRIYHKEPFEIFHYKCATVDEESGKTLKTPACYQPDEQYIIVCIGEKSWGLNNWLKNKKEIVALAKQCPPEINKIITERLTTANDEVVKWETAIKNIKKITI